MPNRSLRERDSFPLTPFRVSLVCEFCLSASQLTIELPLASLFGNSFHIQRLFLGSCQLLLSLRATLCFSIFHFLLPGGELPASPLDRLLLCFYLPSYHRHHIIPEYLLHGRLSKLVKVPIIRLYNPERKLFKPLFLLVIETWGHSQRGKCRFVPTHVCINDIIEPAIASKNFVASLKGSDPALY